MKKFLLACFIFFGFFFNATAQEIKVSGKITDSKDGSAIPGANIRVKNSNRGAITDANGNFDLVSTTANDTLIVSFISYTTKEVGLGGRSIVNVQLDPEASELKEVVVTGFQEVDRKIFTGAAVNVKMSDIKATGMTDASQMLEGKVAGVTVDNVSGTFGTSPKIRIRGNTSISGDSQPLMVVDGVILEDLNAVTANDIISGNASTLTASSIAGINPDDIESFQILKDASATALYGTRAKNGVIVITTKKGKSGQTKVSYSGGFSFHIRPTYNRYDIMNSGDEMSVYREMNQKGLIDITTSVKAQNYGSMGKMFDLISQHQLPPGNGVSGLNEDFLNKYENANTDWFKVLFRNLSLQQQHSVSFTTGTEKQNSYYSLSFLNDAGQTIADKVKRFTGTAKNSFSLSKKLILDVKLVGSYRDQRVPGTQNRDFDPISGRFKRDFDINPLSYALNTARSIRPYDDDGNFEYFRRNYAPFNILKELQLNYININVGDISNQIDLHYDIKENLVFKSTVQGRYATTKREQIINENSNQAEAYRADGTQYIQESNPLLYKDPNNADQPTVVLPEGGFNNLDEDELKYFYIRNSLNWSHTFNAVHNVNVYGGQEIKYTNRMSRRATGIGVVYEDGGVVHTDPRMIDFLNSQGISTYALAIDHERFAGLFLNAGYSFKDKYIFNGTVRYDGSNRLGKSRSARYLPTWNISGAWNLINEDFAQQLAWLSNLKLRGTYGLTANLGPNTSALLNIKSGVTIRPTDVETYLFIQDLENSNLTWEKLKELNVGVDFAFFNNTITGSLDVFHRNCFDLIGVYQTSGVGGASYKNGNYANMKSHGFEFSISTTNLTLKDFRWTTILNLGYARDVITKLDYNPRLGDAIVRGGAAVQGGPHRGLYSTKFAGLDSRGIPTFNDGTGEIVHNIDLQDRDNINVALKYEGSAEPRGAAGLGNTFSYKRLALSVFFSCKFDYKIRLDDSFSPRYTDYSSMSRSFVNRWEVPGDETKTNIPVILDKSIVEGNDSDLLSAYDLYNKSTVRVADGTYVRLKSVRLTYSIANKICKRIGASNAQLSVEGQNLALVISDKKLNGQDPEFFSSGGVALPQPKLITTAITIGF
jgi:TonB-linked SusC/RagA family outer membrane protein